MKAKTAAEAEVLTLTLGTRQLLQALQFVGKAIAANPVVMILENAHVTIRPGEVEFRGDDYSQSITHRIAYNQICETGSFMLPHKKTVEFLKTLPEAPIEIQHIRETKLDERGKEMIVCTVIFIMDSKKFKLASEDHIDFPRQQVFTGERITIPTGQIKEAFNVCLTTASTDTLKPSQCGIHFNTEKGEIVSCNGGNMTIFRTDTPLPGQPFTINTHFAKMVLKNIATDQENVILEVSERSIRISNENQTITSQLITDRYVQYENAIPQSRDLKVSINLHDWAATLRRAMVFANSSFAIKNNFMPGKLIIESEDTDYGNDSTQEIDYDGDVDIKIGLQGRMITTILQKVTSQTGTIEMISPNRAVLIIPDETSAKELIILTMPVMLNTEY